MTHPILSKSIKISECNISFIDCKVLHIIKISNIENTNKKTGYVQ